MSSRFRVYAGHRLSLLPRDEWRSRTNDYNGKHYINAANTAEYDGHTVVNWRGRYSINDSTTVFARVINLLDEKYADRADFTLFNPARYRYFPAMPRQLYVGVTMDF